ncbi:LpqB family beta-propeller domain-containing protein [Arthrobacter sp. HY1533]|uniref:LpqB family beta-propeller domain-containing protein n=1 Tax=Arthrobacter sp. HY1533 TaxID=2970919 RepID=UPI0022BA0EA7|nr:LpqB family beta-propeller domain-containing protein [Arthrobacter sp. HY1533]
MAPTHRNRGGRPGGRLRRNGALGTLVMAVVVLLALAGCATIPMKGTVGKSDPLAPRNNSVNVNFQQFAPVEDASPESIVRGFIEAGTGLNDDFQVARQFLAPGLAQSWSPDQRTLVYRDAFAVAPGTDKDNYVLTFDVVSTVDSMGVLTPEGEGAKESVQMTLEQVDGQWRISKTPNGLILSEATFQTLFSPFPLYFFDPTFTYGVPDVRWLAGRSSRTPTAIVKAMLEGPAPYLKGAVVSAFPNGIALERDSVPVNNGLAKVGLTADALLETTVKQRQQMHSQLLVTLQKALSTVIEVQFLADDREVDMGGPVDAITPMVIDNLVPPTQVALSNNELVSFDGTKITAIPNMPSVAELLPTAPAISYNGKRFAFRSGGNRIYTVVPGQQPVVALSGVAMTPPSFAPNGWLFSAAGDGSGTVMAINPDDGGKLGVPVVLTVPWLVGQEVTTLRVSRDGTRALVISQANGVSQVSITGIFKSGDAPKQLTEPLSMVHTGSPTLGVWAGESSVAVMAPSTVDPVSIEILDLARTPTTMDELPGLEWLSAGSGVRNVHAQTATEFYANVGNSWEVVAKELRQASFAG